MLPVAPSSLGVGRMRIRYVGIPVLVLASMTLAAAPASAKAVQIPIRDMEGTNLLNRDVIVNGTAGDIDSGQGGADFAGKNYITQTAADAICTSDPTGIQDDGIYPANDQHPKIDLPYNNNNNGKNARTIGPSTSALNTFTIGVPKDKYAVMHVIGASSYEANIDVQLNYTDGTNTLKSITFWDWFDPDPDTGYVLIGGTDKASANGSNCFDENGANIYGFKVPADKDKRIKSVTLTRTDAYSANPMLLGLTGKLAD